MNEINLRKQSLILPENFQETLLTREIRFNNGERDSKLIKELSFMYMVYSI